MFGIRSLCLAAFIAAAAVRGEDEGAPSETTAASRVLRAFESVLAQERGIRVPTLAIAPVHRRLRGGEAVAEAEAKDSHESVTIYLFESDVCDVAEFRSAHVVPANSFGSFFTSGCNKLLEFECVSVPNFSEEDESSVPEGVYVQATCGSHPNRFA